MNSMKSPTGEPEGETTYQRHKLSELCTYGACTKPAEEDCQLCGRHRARVNRRKRERQNAQRASLSEAGKCYRCRKPSATFRCPACRILEGRVIPADDAAAKADQWRRDSDGWERFRGKGRRGAPTAAQNDDQDLASALKTLERGRDALAYAHSDGVKQLGRIARRDALDAAASLLELAARFLDEVAERNRKVAA